MAVLGGVQMDFRWSLDGFQIDFGWILDGLQMDLDKYGFKWIIKETVLQMDFIELDGFHRICVEIIWMLSRFYRDVFISLTQVDMRYIYIYIQIYTFRCCIAHRLISRGFVYTLVPLHFMDVVFDLAAVDRLLFPSFQQNLSDTGFHISKLMQCKHGRSDKHSRTYQNII